MNDSNQSTSANRSDNVRVTTGRRLSTETKHSLKTTELPIFVIVALGVLLASALVDATDFGAQEAWKYVTWLTIGYLISRGLAKSGSRDFYDNDGNRNNH
jgi:hypothetical protein